MLSLCFKIIFIEQESEEDICTGCKEEIEGNKYTMLLDFNDPINFPPLPLNIIFCKLCYDRTEQK